MKSIFAMILAFPLYMTIGFSVEDIPFLLCVAILQILAGLEAK